MIRPIIFVSTPLAPQAGDPGWPTGAPRLPEFFTAALHANYKFAEETCREIALAGGAPFAPHLLYCRFLEEDGGAERQVGIECGLTLLAKAHEAWFRLPPWRKELSKGMTAERAAAQDYDTFRPGAMVAYMLLTEIDFRNALKGLKERIAYWRSVGATRIGEVW